ncbi:hypothetical protein [Amnibacterium kyonggiense]|uniref:Uncharacterized protein n=1 Tax=Amnibacterium kyonggiense TaxID=595671 RepID=A0A4R7FQ82_9MICO|nr:hypothetical protein [Amnibacterium kyonggiense]TDS79931.1 hypothetical protein CLV52_0477 [Amnibacterium kyonggiense]
MTLLEIIGAGVGEERIPALPAFSARLDAEHPGVAVAEGDRGPMLASLIAGGRLVPDRGEVLLDGSGDPAALRRAVALVDTPVVAEPAPSLPVRSVVREELRFAGRPSRSRDADAVLRALDLDRWSRAPFLDLPPTDRVRLLLELAALRDGVRALVLTSPERHGGHAAGWRRVAEDLTARGLPVLVIGGAAVRESLPASVTPGAIDR